MQIISLEAENIKCLKAIRIEPKGPLVDIGGKNEAGKTSVLDAIMYGLGGKGKIDEVPIRKGKKNARVTLDLGKYIVTRTFTKSGGHLEVASADGAVYKTPQTLLDNFLSDLTFSPMDFMKAKADDQTGMILKVSGIPFVEEELSSIVRLNVPLPPSDNPLDTIKHVRGAVYDKRHDAGLEVTRLEGVFNGIQIPEGMEGTKRVSVADLFTTRKEMEQLQLKNNAERAKVNTMAREIEDKKKIAQAHGKKIDELRIEIDKLKTRKGEHARRLEGIGSEIMDAEALRQDQKQLASGLMDPVFDEVDKQLSEADYVNTVASDVERKEKAERELQEAQTKHKGYDEVLQQIRNYREDLLQKTVFPIQGLGFDENGSILFEGIPLNQRGTSKQIQVGLAILAALNPELRVVLVKDGNDLDSENVGLIRTWAAEKKYQVWMERVQDEPGKVAFYIEDGELK